MKNHTFKNYDEKLKSLMKSILEMGELVNESVKMTGKSFTAEDEVILKEIRQNDILINELDDKIHNQVTEMLALMNPMAVDLRFITSALKIAISLERGGDLAKNITKRMVRLKAKISPIILEKMAELIKINIEMMSDALDAIKNRDAKLASEVNNQDEEANKICRDIFDIIRQEMRNYPDDAPHLTDIMFAAKNLERIADYAKSIAKTVYYIKTGSKKIAI